MYKTKIYMENNLCTIYKLVFNRMQQFFIENDQIIVNNPAQSDIIIIGSCAAFYADEARSLKIISDVGLQQKPVYVYGCLTTISPEKIKQNKKFYTWNPKVLVESVVEKPKVSWDSVILPTEFGKREEYRIYNQKKQFVGITTGCSFNCSYCPHKIGCGELVSRPQNEILAQIKSLIKENVQTIVFTGIDTACYGMDIEVHPTFNSNFPELLENILNMPENTINYHIAQFNPEGLRFNYQKMISCCRDKRVAEMQLPIQTSSERLLKIMRRNYSLGDVRRFIEAVRSRNKNILFRTDLMVGFPTETKDELDKSINFAIENFDEIAVYGYEYRTNTPIASYKLSFFTKNEICKRVKYTTKKLSDAGKIVHSGGQDISTLIKADRKKENMSENMED